MNSTPVIRRSLALALILLSLFAVSSRAAQSDSTHIYRDLDCDGFDDQVVDSKSGDIPGQFLSATPVKQDSVITRSRVSFLTSVPLNPAHLDLPAGTFVLRRIAALDLITEQLYQMPSSGISSTHTNGGSTVCAGGICTSR
jgi:hypothetical protein